MIVAMKKVTLLVLDEDKDSVLTLLRDLGVMQIDQTAAASVTSISAREQYEQAKRTLSALCNFAKSSGLEVPVKKSERDGSAVLEEAQKRLDESEKISSQIAVISKKLENLAVWGNFDRSQFDGLREKGVNILLCRGSVADFNAAKSVENVECIEVSRIKKDVAFAVISLDELDPKAFPAIKLAADDDPIALRKELVSLEEQQKINKKTKK